MVRVDPKTPRLCVPDPLAEGAVLTLKPGQAHYLVNVLRLGEGARTLLFNGRDGEFAGILSLTRRGGASVRVGAPVRPQESRPDLDYLFAPLKHARLDYMAQKAIEMGAGRLRPIITRRTQAVRVNLARLTANAIEACEQCGAVWTPEVLPAEPLETALARWPAGRLLVFCDEEAPRENPLEALAGARTGCGLGLVVGPEGGFEEEERASLLAMPNTIRLRIGPRILRADTAAVAALALVQATLGDWQAWRRCNS